VILHLTHPEAWDTFAGGTFAASGRHSYQSRDKRGGTYYIDPVSRRSNSEHHLGYVARFTNDKGLIPTQDGLWRQLSGVVTLHTARRICREHFAEHVLPVLKSRGIV